MNSCLLLAAQAAGRQITTIEGLAHSDELHVLQQAFIEAAAIQCGFCSPGMILTATALLRNNPAPSAEEVSEALSGVFCRCTGYVKPVQAVLQAAEVLQRGETFQPEHDSAPSPETQTHPDFAVVGHSPAKVDAVKLARGRAAFTDDIELRGMLHAKLLTSPHAHARIRCIDASRARSLPGVHAVLTYQEVQRVVYTAEQLVWAYYHEHGLPITVVRPVTVYGPRSTPFVVEIVELLKRGSMAYIGGGRKPAGLAYVTNVVDLLLRAADSERSLGQAYNASDGSNVTWRQYVGRLAKIVGAPSPRLVIPYQSAYLAGWAMEGIYAALRIKTRPLLTRLAVELMGTDQAFIIDKARRELGYEPAVNFDEGMRRVEAWLRERNAI